MQYKTIVLELFQQHPQIHQQLLSRRALLQTMDLYARELKTNHEAWKERLSRALPGSNPAQIAGEALEIALWELENSLQAEYPPDDSDVLTIEEATAFTRGPSSPA